VLNIDPGEPIRLRNVTIRVDGPAASAQILSSAQERRAQVRRGAQSWSLRRRQTTDPESGFALRIFQWPFHQPASLVDPRAGVADIELMYESGPRYALGKVKFEWRHSVRRRPAATHGAVQGRRAVRLRADRRAEPGHAIERLFRRRACRCAPYGREGPGDSGQRQTRDAQAAHHGPWVGYSSDVGPRIKANWTRHWVNPQGHSYGWESELSAPRQNVGLFYDIPLDPPLTDKLRWAGGYQFEDIDGSDT
jgi:translocation and assembly module TamA